MTKPAGSPAAPVGSDADEAATVASTAAAAEATGGGGEPAAPSGAKRPPLHPPGSGWLWAAIVILALTTGTLLGVLWYWEEAARQADAARLAAKLEAELPDRIARQIGSEMAALETRLVGLEARITELPDLSTFKETESAVALLVEKTEGLSNRIADIEKAMSRIKTDLAELSARAAAEGGEGGARAAARIAEEMTALNERLAALERAQQESPSGSGAGRRQALVVAVGQLRTALANSRPFASELGLVASLGEGDAEVARAVEALRPFAGTGAATVAELRDGFGPVAAAVVRADRLARETGWFGRLFAQLGRVISVRRTGPDVPGETAEAVVARAEQSLALGDLDGAVRELGKLSGPAAEPAADWLARARARLACEERLRELELHAIGTLGQAGAVAP